MMTNDTKKLRMLSNIEAEMEEYDRLTKRRNIVGANIKRMHADLADMFTNHMMPTSQTILIPFGKYYIVGYRPSKTTPFRVREIRYPKTGEDLPK